MRVGYARVSSKSQNLARQLKTLKKDHCKQIFKEKISGATTKRPQLHKMLNFIRKGDIVEVTAIDRLGRNKDDDLDIMRRIKNKGAMIDIANFTMMSAPVKKQNEDDNHYKQRINTYSFVNSIMIQAIAYVAETERREIKERQKQGIKIAKENGTFKGRPMKFTNDDPKVKRAFTRYFQMKMHQLKMSMTEIANASGMSRRTLYRKLNQYKPKPKDYLSEKDYRFWIVDKHPDSKLADKIVTKEWHDEDRKRFGQRYNIENPHI